MVKPTMQKQSCKANADTGSGVGLLKESIEHVMRRIAGRRGRGSGASVLDASAGPGRERQPDGKARPLFVTVMELSLMPVALFAINVSDLYNEALRNGIWVVSGVYAAVVYYLVGKHLKGQSGQWDAGAEGRGYYVLGWAILVVLGIAPVALLIFVISSTGGF